ncbi:MAG: hypothetical protein H9W80_08965 [Enterococcus sp.]|nr:hypothetical protein [Enterococcus sp.]
MNTTTKENNKIGNKRRFSVEEDFMSNKLINSYLYAYLQFISKFNAENEDTKKRYVLDKEINFSVLEEEFKNEIGKKVGNRKKLSKDFKLLISMGLLMEGKEENQKVYYLTYNESDKYKLIPNLTLEYLLRIKHPNVCKVYLYLLNKYDWKKETNEKYLFTKKEINLAIGLSDRATNNTNLEYILTDLNNNGLLAYRELLIPSSDKNKAPIHYYELTEVATEIRGLDYSEKGKRKVIKSEGNVKVLAEKEMREIPKEPQLKLVEKNDKKDEYVDLSKVDVDYCYNWIEDFKKKQKEKDFFAF